MQEFQGLIGEEGSEFWYSSRDFNQAEHRSGGDCQATGTAGGGRGDGGGGEYGGGHRCVGVYIDGGI